MASFTLSKAHRCGAPAAASFLYKSTMALPGSASHLHPDNAVRRGTEEINTGPNTMICIRAFVIGSLLTLLEAHKQCAQRIRWGNLYKGLASMSTDISGLCAQHYNTDSLCDPAHILNQVELSAVLLMDIMEKAESIYRKNPNPQDLIPGLQHAQNMLTACVHHAHNVDLEPVSSCFNKLESFLHDNTAHIGCAWEIVNARMRELLQRLEKRTHTRRR